MYRSHCDGDFVSMTAVTSVSREKHPAPRPPSQGALTSQAQRAPGRSPAPSPTGYSRELPGPPGVDWQTQDSAHSATWDPEHCPPGLASTSLTEMPPSTLGS